MGEINVGLKPGRKANRQGERKHEVEDQGNGKEDKTIQLKMRGTFPGGPVVKTLCFHCRGHGFDP